MFRFTVRKLPTPGVGNYAFEPEYTLPLMRFTGVGVPTIGAMSLTSPALIARFGIPTAGLGGVISGQMTYAPLIVPSR